MTLYPLDVSTREKEVAWAGPSDEAGVVLFRWLSPRKTVARRPDIETGVSELARSFHNSG
jgi:hypothetical protein